MVFRQITHDDLGCASYLIGDEDAAVAAVVEGLMLVVGGGLAVDVDGRARRRGQAAVA